MNNILAHRPWKLTSTDLYELLNINTPNKNSWNRDEFVHASLILINFHRLAAIAESLKICICDKSSNDLNNINEPVIKSSNFGTTDGKKDLYNNLIKMNEEGDKQFKKCDKEITSDDIKIIYNHDDMIPIFEKHISNFCTLYLDFDNYSETPLSSIVFFKINVN